MNCERGDEPKNSFMAATTGRMFIREWGVSCSKSWACRVMRSRMTLSRREKPILNWFCKSSPTQRMRRLLRWSISSVSPNPWARQFM